MESTLSYPAKTKAATTANQKPLISVVITCYNHGSYLAHAIESVLSQEFEDVEIIVVDDGSVDNTKAVALKYDVKYVYQHNQGLSAARNTGIDNSRGQYLVFLDADDWLLPKALATNLQYLLKNKNLAFVSGAHELFFEDSGDINTVQKQVDENHYNYFLSEGNYIGMHATVMYQAWVFDKFRYNTKLKACEDYEMYLKVARKYPVHHHTDLIASYRMHDSNMSGDIPKMLDNALKVLATQEEVLADEIELDHYKNGIRFWKEYYCKLLYGKVLYNPDADKIKNKAAVATLRKEYPSLHLKYLIKRPIMPYRNLIKNLIPNFALRTLNRLGFYQNYIPKVGQVKLGDLNRTVPFSREFGYDRGGPVDRYYIESFLEKNQHFIKGRVLEIAENEYTLKYGNDKLTKSEILHIDNTNPNATIVGDLSDAPHIPDNSFDCIILTQTLHLIYEYRKAIETCYRILKPGGTLLLTVPGISHIDQGEWYKYWLWSFTDTSIKRVMAEHFPVDKTTVQPFGNVLIASAFLYGMSIKEMKREQLDYQDPHYQVIITVTATKPA